MYENITDKKVITECRKKLNSEGKRDAMIINLALLSFAMVELDSADVERDNADKLIYHYTTKGNRTLVGWNRNVEGVKVQHNYRLYIIIFYSL